MAGSNGSGPTADTPDNRRPPPFVQIVQANDPSVADKCKRKAWEESSLLPLGHGSHRSDGTQLRKARPGCRSVRDCRAVSGCPPAVLPPLMENSKTRGRRLSQACRGRAVVRLSVVAPCLQAKPSPSRLPAGLAASRQACGVWRVACGVWRVACGVWRVAGGSVPVSSRAPAWPSLRSGAGPVLVSGVGGQTQGRRLPPQRKLQDPA